MSTKRRVARAAKKAEEKAERGRLSGLVVKRKKGVLRPPLPVEALLSIPADDVIANFISNGYSPPSNGVDRRYFRSTPTASHQSTKEPFHLYEVFGRFSPQGQLDIAIMCDGLPYNEIMAFMIRDGNNPRSIQAIQSSIYTLHHARGIERQGRVNIYNRNHIELHYNHYTKMQKDPLRDRFCDCYTRSSGAASFTRPTTRSAHDYWRGDMYPPGGHYMSFIKVVNGTPNPKTGRFDCHYLVVPHPAGHATTYGMNLWTYQTSQYYLDQEALSQAVRT